MNRKYRLTRSSDIQRVRRLGRSYAHPLLILIVENSQQNDQPRLAFLASKSLGNAVNRNRAKRILREVFRHYIASIENEKNILVIARAGLLSSPFFLVQNGCKQILYKARLISENDTNN